MRAPYSPVMASYRRFTTNLLNHRTPDGFLVKRTAPLLFPVHLASAVGNQVLQKVLPTGSKPRISQELRDRLIDYYAQDITGLEQRLDRDLSNWRR